MIDPYEMRTCFAATLTDMRVQAGLSQKRLAERAGIDHSYLSRLEMLPDNRNRREPSHEMVGFLADALNLSARDRAELFMAAGYVTPEMYWRPFLAALDELDAMCSESEPDVERCAGMLAHALGQLVHDALSGERAGMQLMAAQVAGLSLHLVDLLQREHAAIPQEIVPSIEAVAS